MNDAVAQVKQLIRKRASDLAPRTRPSRPAASAALDADEARLGFRLPPLLRRLYTEIGNGGFGPGYGLIGMSGGMPDDTGRTAPESYHYFRMPDPDDSTWTWPEGLLPICHWGCAIYSCIDCADPRFRVRRFDPNEHDDSESWDDAFSDECESFDDWIQAWAEGADLWARHREKTGYAGDIPAPAAAPPASRRKRRAAKGTRAQPAAVVGRRLNRAFGPIVAGLIIDGIDLATYGPIGLYLGLPIGGLAGYWMGRCLRLEQKHALLCALAAGIYCTIPFTELVPLATMVGAYARFRESGREHESGESENPAMDQSTRSRLG